MAEEARGVVQEAEGIEQRAWCKNENFGSHYLSRGLTLCALPYAPCGFNNTMRF